MNNPNPEYHGGPAVAPEDDFDHERFFDHVFDALTVRETEIRRWFEAEGFVDVKVRRLPLFGPDWSRASLATFDAWLRRTKSGRWCGATESAPIFGSSHSRSNRVTL
jgi:hypothetical protein